MQRETLIKSIGLGGSSDLSLLAPIKPGLVASLESMSYKTRVKRVLALLHAARRNAHEYAAARLMSDAVERVGVIHSVRVVVFEAEDKVLLSVTFDGSWEAYIRVLWDKVGALLDLIFCNTEGYVTACDHDFETWAAWVRRVQRETGFFYGPPNSTAADVLFDRRLLRMREREPFESGTALAELRAALPAAEEAVQRLVRGPVVRDDPPTEPVNMFLMAAEQMRQYLPALAGLYRLTDYYQDAPGGQDGQVLRRAAIELLRELVELWNGGALHDEFLEQRVRFARELDWLFPGTRRVALERELPPLDPSFKVPADVRADVQGGILRAYEHVTHGALLLFHFASAADAHAFLAALEPEITRDSAEHAATDGQVYRNVAITPEGLRAVGLAEDELECFPEEFRQGMAQRAGALGDVRHNHPRRWRRPRRFISVDQPAGGEAIELSAVHLVLQLRCGAVDSAGLAALEISEAHHPLRREVANWSSRAPGVQLLAVQTMRRRHVARNDAPAAVEHFGFADGFGQPEAEYDAASREDNRIHLGELVWGHPNRSDAAPPAGDPRRAWLDNGSFLVLRKYRQYVDRLESAVQRTAEQMRQRLGGSVADHAETVYAKLMGRRRDGTPLVEPEPGTLNHFDYDDDPQGQRCPLHAHIRRAHPRTTAQGASRPPRLMRRGMSYGPDAGAGAEHERGMVFMAYNQSLAEQFEVVQRWLVGGNSSGSSSAASCPFLGVPENGYPRVHRFEARDDSGQAHVFQIELEARTPLFDEPAALTRLEWGLYAFAPGLQALRRLRDRAVRGDAPRAPPWVLEQGRQLIRQLLAIQDEAPAIQAWKQALEDSGSIDRLYAAAIWAALRLDWGGLLPTPYGTLVADRELLHQVLNDAHGMYSVSGQRKRMLASFGDIYLGLDAGEEYERQSARMNAAIGRLDFDTVFGHARGAASAKIDAIVAQAHAKAAGMGQARWDSGFDMREVLDDVLAALSEWWFGVQDKSEGLLARGGSDLAWNESLPGLYPGLYTALSRNMFQPNPGRVPKTLGESYGKALRKRMEAFVQRHRAAGTVPRAPDGSVAPLAEAAFDAFAQGHDADFVGRLMNGVLMGFTPTIIGAVANVLIEWRRSASFGAMRSALAGRADAASARQVCMSTLHTATRMRPMPQITWRTVLADHELQGRDGKTVQLKKDEIVVLGLVSGTQQSLADGQPDACLMFGGKRSDTPHPTHACPGMTAGLAAMLGSLSALLGRTETLREGATPLSFWIEGPVQTRVDATRMSEALVAAGVSPARAIDRAATIAAGTQQARRERSRQRAGAARGDAQAPATLARAAVHGGQTGTILAWGDSWLAYELGSVSFGTDLRDWIEHLGYQIPRTFCDFRQWGTIRAMAQNPAPFVNAFAKAVTPSKRPRALLLSGGGNDSTRSRLAALLNTKGQAGHALDPARVNAHIVALRDDYMAVLSAIAARQPPSPVPVVIHGYDHPIPAGQGLPFQREWLHDVFVAKGYTLANGGVDLTVARRAMSDLIDALNVMLASLAATFPFVRYVDLRGTIEAQFPGQVVNGWRDDLHPADPMFKLMAAKINDAIKS